MDLSIVIVNFNTAGFLPKCLDNLSFACQGLDYEIFIVDNASPEGFPDDFPSNHKHLHVIKNRINVGFAKANNQALRESKGDFILLLNPDVEISKNTIHELLDILKKNSKSGAASCKTYWDQNMKFLFSTLKVPDIKTALFENTVLGKLFPDNKLFKKLWEIDYNAWSAQKPIPVSGMPAAILMIKADVLRKIDYFDEAFFLYYEDKDLCKRIQNEGFDIYFLPHVDAVHHYGQSTKNENWRFLNETIKKSRNYYYIKHFGWKGNLLKLSISLNDLIAEAIKKIHSIIRTLNSEPVKGDKEIKLSWKPQKHINQFCFELSVEPHFLHKVGMFLDSTEYTLPSSLLKKLPPANYFWRCSAFKENGEKIKLNSGNFIKK